jgi:ATP-dependent helicase Lhr and Lhr-like helicase
VSPLSVPILLEIGREAVAGFAREELLREAAAQSMPRETLEETQCSS